MGIQRIASGAVALGLVLAVACQTAPASKGTAVGHDAGRAAEQLERGSTTLDATVASLKSLVEDVYADVPAHLRRQYNRFLEVAGRRGQARPGDGAFPL